MGEKDISEKTLEAYNDVFSDIVNVLLFDGKEVVKEDALTDASPLSQYKAENKLHEQERDVAKYWKDKNSNIRICLYGLENQTAIDIDIPLRVISYDGAAYRAQLLDDKDKGKQKRYPVVTLVLYFGEKRWNRPHSLKECLDIPKELEPYVSDYKVNVFEIAWLEDETVQKFKSDFKIVADYFVQVRKNKNYVPSREKIKHVNEILTLMSVLTHNEKFEEAQLPLPKNGGGINMYDAFAQIETKGFNAGILKGKAEGFSKGRNEILSLSNKLFAANRIEDLRRASTDEAYCTQLLKEFGLYQE